MLPLDTTTKIAAGSPVGEVIETSLSTYIAQACELDSPPPFGGLVWVKDRSQRRLIYGLVYSIATGGIDPGRRATARNNTGVLDEQVYSSNPQLSRLLRTEFGVVVLGCRLIDEDGVKGNLSYIMPDYPPPLHYSVYVCDDMEVAEFTENPRYLNTLLNTPQAPVEELIAAIMRRGATVRGGEVGHLFLVDTGRALAKLLKDDFDRLQTILEKCEG